MASRNFGSQKGPGGAFSRSGGPIMEHITDLRRDVDAGFTSVESEIAVPADLIVAQAGLVLEDNAGSLTLNVGGLSAVFSLTSMAVEENSVTRTGELAADVTFFQDGEQNQTRVILQLLEALHLLIAAGDFDGTLLSVSTRASGTLLPVAFYADDVPADPATATFMHGGGIRVSAPGLSVSWTIGGTVTSGLSLPA